MRCLIADATSIQLAADLIAAGGVVAVPTDTLYGLAVDPFRADAVARLFAVKGRAADQAVPLIAADVAQVALALGELPPVGRRLAETFWPGPLTLLVPAPRALAAAVTAGSGRVGVRVPAHEVARDLCHACGRPLTATSANASGAPPSSNPDEVARALGDRIDLVLVAPVPGGPPSTIVDVTGPVPRLVRAGAIGWDHVQACLDRA
jgi:L-threonylcarbamoyladenylate synthase